MKTRAAYAVVTSAVAFFFSSVLAIGGMQAPSDGGTDRSDGLATLQWESMNGPPGCGVRRLTLDPHVLS